VVELVIKATVWDIGGVLLENPFIGKFWKDLEGSVELRHKFGSGQISRDEFVEKASRMLGIKKEDFLQEYGKAYFPIKKIDEVFEIYKNIKLKKYLFSDTNPIHAEFIKEKYDDLFKLSDQNFLSNEIGFRKSQKEYYLKVIKLTKLVPQEILLIDDSKEVVKLAQQIGFETILYTNPADLKNKLKDKGVEV
jgi:glucose-1-phosphatase